MTDTVRIEPLGDAPATLDALSDLLIATVAAGARSVSCTLWPPRRPARSGRVR